MGDLHSVIPPSSAHIWGAPDGCTGWVSMSQQYPDTEDSPEAADGTAAHEVAERMIKSAAMARAWNNSREGIDYGVASNGVVISTEMVEAAELYADDVTAVMRSAAVFGGDNLAIEQSIKIPSIHAQSFGTPDCWLFDSKTGDLYIWDFKFGYDVVEAFENWQLMNYVSGVIDLLKINGIADQYINVHIRIAQPRAFHGSGSIREWVVKASDLRPYFNTLHTNAHVALSGNATTKSGPHCKHCTARHACPAALQAALKLYEVAGQPLPVELPLNALGVQLAIVRRAIKQLEYIESGLSEQIKGLLKSGKNIPGWQVEAGVGREKWIKPAAEVMALGDMFKIDLRKPTDIMTPVQARKLGIDEAVIMAYSEKPSTGLKLVPENGNKTKQIFQR